ncbi:MAG: hypothetical protein HY223_08560 [Thaumarchaeota archaeon]|nr:hypothetical protein [Nitrososphaerota archaeon]
MKQNGSAIALISILVLQIFAVAQYGSTGTSFTGSHDAFAQKSGSDQPSYIPYQNNNEGVSVEYPSDWTYSEKTRGQAMLTYFYPPNDPQTFLELSYDKTADYTGTDKQILGEMSQILSILCSNASIAKNGFTCSDFQYKTGAGKYQGAPSYVMHGRMTETFSDGSTREQDIVQFLIINQNSDYGIFATCPKDKCSNYDSELTHLVNSLNIYSLNPTNNLNADTQVSSYNIPSWIKNNAKLWSQDAVTDDDFVKGLQYLIQQGMITVPTTQISSQSSQTIPSWVKNTAKWWSEGQVGDSDFVKGIQYLVQNGIIATQTADQGHTAVTDQQGMVTFQISGQDVQFSFVDDTTGQPLARANIVLSVDPQTQSVGTLLVIDPSKHYPVQVILLIPSQTSSTTPTSLNNYFIPSASAQSEEVVKVTVTTSVRQAGNLLSVSFLHKVHQVGRVVEKVNSVYDSLALALKYADKNGWLPVSGYLQNHGYETGSISSEEAIDKIKDENKQGKIIDGLFLIGSGGANMPAYMLSRVVGEITAKVDINTVSGCNSQQVQYVEVGPAIFYNCPSDKTSGLLKYEPPAETTDHVSLDILSKANQGFGERIQTDKGQPVSVPADDYSVRVSSPGKNPVTEDLTVTPDQITDVTAVPQPIPNNAMTTTITPAGDLSGHWSGSFSMKDTTSDGCSFSGTWEATLTQNDNDLSGSISIIEASSPDYPENDFCTLAPATFNFEGGTVSSSSFQFDSSDFGGFQTKGYFTTDLIHGNFNECSDESCATGTFTGSRG